MELIAAITIWVLFASYLLFSMLRLPPAFHRTALTLVWAEFIALLMDSFGGQTVAAIGRQLAAVDVPLLGVALLTVVVMRAWQSTRVGPPPRRGRSRGGAPRCPEHAARER